MPPAVLLAALVGVAVGCSGDEVSTSGGGDDAVGADPPDTNAGEGGDAGGGAPAADATAPEPTNGLRATYYDDFFTPTLTRVDPTLDFNWPDADDVPGAGLRHEYFSVRWRGTLTPKQTDRYTLSILADDGVRLRIDGKLAFESWKGQSPTELSAAVDLTAGKPHSLEIEYFQLDQGATLRLFWSSKSQPKEIVPADRLKPATPGKVEPAPRPTFQNAVVRSSCPDPGVLRVGGREDGSQATWYMACTGGTFKLLVSRDLVAWKDAGASLMPTRRAPWAVDGGRNWAPEMHANGNGYLAYYTASGAGNRLSIGVASAPSPTGPWTHATQPLVRDANLGAIDATFFIDDDGKRWLYWKLDGNAVGAPTPILVQELRADGLAFAPGSSPVEVLRNEPATWEGGVVEAPWVVKRAGTYYLFYSGNGYDERYRTGVAKASSPRGPFVKKGPPILRNNGSWVGPGHGSVVTAHGADYYVHHAWPTLPGGARNDAAGRWALVQPIQWVDGWPRMGNETPTIGLQAYP